MIAFGQASADGRILHAAEAFPAGRIRGLGKRVIACLDVRSNDQGDLVVTKGDQYDVRERDGAKDVRNLGLPVALADRYFTEGADEVAFLNITGFRDSPLGDMPMLQARACSRVEQAGHQHLKHVCRHDPSRLKRHLLLCAVHNKITLLQVLRHASEKVFVPLTVGGGIRAFTDANGKHCSALDVAAEYFRSGADKVSIGSDAVYAAEEYLRTGQKSGQTSIEQISWVSSNGSPGSCLARQCISVCVPLDTIEITCRLMGLRQW